MAPPKKVVKSKVKQVVRGIGMHNQSNPEENVFSVAEIDVYLSSIVDSGYTLKDTHMIGQWSDAFFMSYVFTLNE